MKQLTLIASVCILLLTACGGGKTGEITGGKTPGDSTRIKISQLTEQIGKDGSNPLLFNSRAKAYLISHDFDLALKDIRQALSLDNKNPELYITLADIYLLMGKPEESRDALQKAIALDSKSTGALLKLAKLYLIVKDYKNCYSTVKTILDIDNGVAQAYYTRAIGLIEQGDTVRAVEDLKKAVDRNQEYYEAYVELGEMYAVKKDAIAELYFKNALKIWPQSREALYNLGLFYQETGKYEPALQTYRMLAAVDSTSRDAFYNPGYIYLVYLNDYNRAIQFFSAALKKDPNYYQAWYNRGYAYELSGNYKKAAEDYQQSLKIEVNYDKAIEGLNRIDKHLMQRK